MAVTFTRQLLSSSTNGRCIPVGAVASPGTLIHTATGAAGAFDEVSLWASNVSNAAATITIEWGGTNNPGDHLVDQFSLPANCPPVPVVTGQSLNGGLAVRAYSSVANAINLTGHVNRIQ